MDNKLQKIAQTGYIPKGSVYAITGILTFLEAINIGGRETSKLKVLEFLDKQPFGNVLLLIMAVGLISYSYWRFSQAISDPENIGLQESNYGAWLMGLVAAGFIGYAVYMFMMAKYRKFND